MSLARALSRTKDSRNYNRFESGVLGMTM
jgi:hypothetical protein